jgi:hypothetical protein
MNHYYLSWWNVENLFDVENSTERSDKLNKVLNKELAGWDDQILERKLDQLAKVIRRMNDNTGPDIFGLCEVENKKVLLKLRDKLNNSLPHSYSVVHSDTQDRRGIDVAFIYDSNRFNTPSEIFSHWIIKRNATRDILQVNFRTKSSGRLLIVIGNHWPSRSGGQLGSEPYRIVAGETISYYHQRILEIHGKDTPILVMGDFNDEPFNRSVTDHALAVNNKIKTINARNPTFYNLMWPLMTGENGTSFYEGFNVIDQLWISKGIVKGDIFSVKNSSMKIIQHDDMVDIDSDYKKPLRFGRPSNKLNRNGFSDHFPIRLVLQEN